MEGNFIMVVATIIGILYLSIYFDQHIQAFWN